MIEVKDIVVKTKGFSLNDVSLTVKTGSCHVIIGPTGCGKTTLIEAIIGFRPIQRGRILLNGTDITALPVNKRGFSYVPQDLALFPHMTVEENILYGIKYGNLSEKKARIDAAYEIAALLGITYLFKRKPANLSGGERQRVALARALAPGHKYILLDEPLSALHEGMKKELWFLLKALQNKYELTMILVSHDMNETFFLADDISVMIDGVIQQTDEKKMLYNHPANSQIATYFGIKNIFDGEIINITEQHYKVYCKDINTEIQLPIVTMKSSLCLGTHIVIGIKAEDVIILRPDLPIKNDNLIDGIVTEIHFAGTKSIIMFKPQNSNRLIEIIMPEFALSKLNLKPQAFAIISLKSERIFALKK